MRLLAAILLVLVYLTRVRTGLLNAGPYNLKLERFEPCENVTSDDAPTDWQTIKKSTHKTFIHGPMFFPVDVDDSLRIRLNFSRFGSRGWGLNAYNLRNKNFCSGFKSFYPALFDFYYKAWGIENPSCPIKAGNYTLDLDTDLPRLTNLPFLPYGRYRISQYMLRGKPAIKFACGTWYVTCYERPR